VHFPIIDCDIGEDFPVYGLAVELVDRLHRGEVIYLHCWGGHGRTGSLVCLMLNLMYGLDAKTSMERCQVYYVYFFNKFYLSFLFVNSLIFHCHV
jgi:protein-tyrosine phosphatase